ncbi:MAG: dihydroorotase [Candidatus Peregrinibacteria bacterium]
MAKIIIKNGEVVSGRGVVKKDILIDGGKIAGVFERGKCKEKADEIDVKGKVVLPGVVDVHVHFRDPGEVYKEGFESGSRAAAAGGVTTVCDMPNNKPPVLTCKDLEAKRKLVSGRSYVDYGFYIGYDGKNIDEINRASNIPGVKVYCADSTGNMGVDGKALEELFEKVDKKKMLVFHAEDADCIRKKYDEYMSEFAGREADAPASIHSKIRDMECAAIMVKTLCELAKKHTRPIHICHVSTEEELDVIAEYKKYGVTCEVAPHHLTLCDDDYEYLGNYIKVNPPVRSRFEIFGLWKNLKAGVIDIVASDHAPHTKEEKDEPYVTAPAGVPGVEMLLPILLNTVNNEGMTLEEVAQLCCEKPAEIFGIMNKGKIAVGYDADIVIVDMDMEKEFKNGDVFSKCGWSPYSGSVFKGWPVMTFVGGEMIYKEGKIVSKPQGKEAVFA